MKQNASQTEPSADLLNEDLLWGAPKRSDAEFLVAFRSRLSRPIAGLWLSSRKIGLIAGLAVVLLVGVWLPVKNSRLISTDVPKLTLETSIEEFVTEDADANDLADYLGVPETAEDWEFESNTVVSGVSASELLELEPQELEIVLAEIQETVFF